MPTRTRRSPRAAVDQTRRPAVRRPWLPAVLIALAAMAAYANSVAGVFVFDDEPAIVQNEHIRALWPLTTALSAPPGTTLSGRPFVSVTFALNYAFAPAEARSVLSLPPGPPPVDLSQRYLDNLRGYHLVNLAIHIAAALALFGIVRRTLLRTPVPLIVRQAASGVALATATLWAVHPLQTSAVTYVVQRAESLMGLCFLVTLYAAIRALDGSRRWFVTAIVACALGMASKESMAGAPLVVLAWDFFFARDRGESGAASVWPRRGLYAGLASTWILLAVLVAGNHRPDAAGFGFAEWPWWRYLLTQAGVIAHYLRLAVVPSPLVLDYAWPAARGIADVWPQLVWLVILVALTLWGCVRRVPAAFAGVWFFVTLAPTSSVYPIVSEVAAEHRMYLPLAAVVALLVAGARVVLVRSAPASARAAGWTATLALVVACIGATRARNEDYHSFERIWADTVAKQPANARARNNYATALVIDGRLAEAEVQAREAVRLEPRLAEAHSTLGVALCGQGRCAEGLPALREAVALAPDFAEAHRNLAEAQASGGDLRHALASYTRALELRPDDVLLLNRIGWILATAPDASLRDGPRAIALGQRAVLLTLREDVESLDTLAAAYADAGRFTEAIATADEALQLAPAREPAIVPELEARLRAYREGRAWRQ